MSTQPKIYVAGHRGMVGSAIVRQLLVHGHPAEHILTHTHVELDLTDQASVRAFFAMPCAILMLMPRVNSANAHH